MSRAVYRRIAEPRSILAMALIGTLLLALSALGRAATIPVGTLNDTTGMGGCSLRDAITTANGTSVTGSGCATTADASNTINFSLSGTLMLTSTLPAIANSSPGSLTIDGSGQSITVDGASKYQIFTVNSGATLNLQFLTLAHGSVTGTGGGDGAGGAIINAGTLTVTNSTFSANTATGNPPNVDGLGGGIFNAEVGTLTVTNSTFSANTATGGNAGIGIGGNSFGGAIANDGTLTVTNSTFSANTAAGGIDVAVGVGEGGAIYSQGTLTLTNSTFSANQATGASGTNGGAIFNDAGTVNLKGIILAAGSPDNCAGAGTTISSASYNIADDASCFTNGVGNNVVVSQTSDIGLASALADNGGPTQTLALEPGSPAIDAIPQASCTYPAGAPNPCTTTGLITDQLTCDQRGQPRPDPVDGTNGPCDVGAFEFQDTFTFAGQPGKANCHGKSVSALAKEFGGIDAAASALGYPSVKALQAAISQFCGG